MTSINDAQATRPEGITGRTLTVLTWNMGAGYGYNAQKHAAAWKYLLTRLQPDIALLQEVHADQVAAVTQRAEYQVEWSAHHEGGSWGSAVLCKGLPLERVNVDRYPWLTRFDGAAITCRVQIGRTELLVCSIHARAEAIAESELAGIDIEGMSVPGFKDVWPLYVIFNDLTSLVEEAKNDAQTTSFIVGGDLNASRQFDRRYGPRGNDAFFDQACDRGFVDLTARVLAEEPQTFFRAGNAPYQLDYLFSDQQTASQVADVSVDQDVVVELGLSDHSPVIARVDLSATARLDTHVTTSSPH